MKSSPSPVNEPKHSRRHFPELNAPAIPAEVEQLQQQLEQQSREIDRLQMLSTIDPVTGIANRRRFDEELARLVAEFDRLQRGFCLVVVDLDEFKEINDQLGHPAGDRVLATFAQSLRQQLRTTDILARVGGDEFAMIFPATDAGSARLIVQRAREQMASELAEAAGDASVGWSAGFAEMKTGWTIAQLLVAADQSMYSAKRERSSRVASAKEKPDIRPGLSK